eukprot:10974629-Alexandrium_andersonii.AAC.1
MGQAARVGSGGRQKLGLARPPLLAEVTLAPRAPALSDFLPLLPGPTTLFPQGTGGPSPWPLRPLARRPSRP